MNILTHYEWSTHIPIIRAVMELYKPNFVLELGTGINSTPVFLEYKTRLMSIENDPAWMEYVKDKLKTEIILHDLHGIQIGAHLSELTNDQKADMVSYYSGLRLPNLKPKLLFVDQFTSCRTISINTLGDKFDLIIYHDCQPDGIKWYDYDLINLKGFVTYYLKTPTSWTAFMVRDDKGFELLDNAIKPHIQNYMKEYPDVEMMELWNGI